VVSFSCGSLKVDALLQSYANKVVKQVLSRRAKPPEPQATGATKILVKAGILLVEVLRLAALAQISLRLRRPLDDSSLECEATRNISAKSRVRCS